ncbi:hypothetical protein, partial [Klebsiella pneumoniae]|uniref:hypothetical protein n=1 Tax=Klebsiella pneumoniae TaxID=573 RepID=UPI0019D6D445
MASLIERRCVIIIISQNHLMSYQVLIHSTMLGAVKTNIFDITSNQVGIPAELKHINKRRMAQ